MVNIPVLLRSQLHRLVRDSAGGVAPLVALGAFPLLLSVGAAVDYSRATDAKAAMQAALDATALAVTRAVDQGSTVPDAQSMFQALFSRPEVSGVTVTSSTKASASGTTATLSAQGTLPTAFMKLMGASQLTIVANSVAATQYNLNGCVMALSTTASPAISLGGSTNVSLSNCALYSNSASTTAVTVGGSANLTADRYGRRSLCLQLEHFLD